MVPVPSGPHTIWDGKGDGCTLSPLPTGGSAACVQLQEMFYLTQPRALGLFPCSAELKALCWSKGAAGTHQPCRELSSHEATAQPCCLWLLPLPRCQLKWSFPCEIQPQWFPA